MACEDAEHNQAFSAMRQLSDLGSVRVRRRLRGFLHRLNFCDTRHLRDQVRRGSCSAWRSKVEHFYCPLRLRINSSSGMSEKQRLAQLALRLV
jgi:hypothetical protein